MLELVRRTDGALRSEPSSENLRAAALDLAGLADVLAAWADDPTLPRPDAEVDQVGRRVFDVLAALGVAREVRPPRRS